MSSSQRSVACCDAQRLAGAGRADATVGDDHEVVAEPLDDVELVRREQHGRTGCRDIRQHALHRLDGHRVEARERLVEHEHLGAVHEGGGDLRALLVAEREALDRVVRALAEAEALEQLERVAPGRRGRPAVQAGEVHGLLEQAHLRVQAALLGHVAEAAAVGVGERGAAEGHRAAVGREHAEDDPHRGGLAGAVAADESGEAAVADGEAHRIEGEALAVALGDVVEFEHEATVRMPRAARHPSCDGFRGSAVRGIRPVRASGSGTGVPDVGGVG